MLCVISNDYNGNISKPVGFCVCVCTRVGMSVWIIRAYISSGCLRFFSWQQSKRFTRDLKFKIQNHSDFVGAFDFRLHAISMHCVHKYGSNVGDIIYKHLLNCNDVFTPYCCLRV